MTASDILFHEIDTFRRRNKTPIVAVMMDVAASGGYYVALAADTIVAHPTTVTGSIGVILLTVNADGLLQKIGVTTTAIKSGPLKDMGTPLRSLTPEERAIFQSVIDDLHGQFVAKVVERRQIPLETAKTLADGRIYTAQQALATSSSIVSAIFRTRWPLPARPPGSTKRGSSSTSAPESTAPRTLPGRGAKATSMSRSPTSLSWSCRDRGSSTSGGPDAPSPETDAKPSHCHTGSPGYLTKRASVSLLRHRMKIEPRAEATRRAC